jgi:hypothetical protein
MNNYYLENMPDDILMYILDYYMIGLKYRINLKEMKELIEFTRGEPQMILKRAYNFEESL